MNKRLPPKAVYYFLLGFIFLFHAFVNILWLRENILAPFWDEARHLTIALHYSRVLHVFLTHAKDAALNLTLDVPLVYGPFFYAVASWTSLILGTSRSSLILTNLVFMLILLFSTFKIGELLFDRKAGLAAVFILSFYPLVFGLSRIFLLDYAMTAMAALSVYLLIKTRFFQDTRFVALFALSAAAGFLIKIYFILFLAGPFLYTLYFGWRTASPRKTWLNIALFLLIWLLLPLSWYQAHHMFPGQQHFIRNDVFLESEEPLRYGLLGPLLFYFKQIIAQTGIFWFLFFMAAVAHTLFQKKEEAKREYGFFALWIALPLLSFYSYAPYPRYAAPYLPAMALVTASWIVRNWKRLWMRVVSCALAVLSVIYFFILSFAFLGNTALVKKFVFSPMPIGAQTMAWIVHPAYGTDWKIGEVLRFISEDARKGPATVGLLVDTDCVNNETFLYYAYDARYPLRILRCLDRTDEKCFESDYLITLSDPRSWHWDVRKGNVSALDGLLKGKYGGTYDMVRSFDISSGGKLYTLYVYKRRAH